MQTVLITGISSGLGRALAGYYIRQSTTKLLAMGRSCPEELTGHCTFFPCDLADSQAIDRATTLVSREIDRLDLAILNAGILGEIQDLRQTSVEILEHLMQVNVWANKRLIDHLSQKLRTFDQVVAISSGASINGHRGWGGYSLSKAALNMLIRLYSRELVHTHFTALAPGVVRTPMVEHIINKVDDTRFPSARVLKEGNILSPQNAARIVAEACEKVRLLPSGEYRDVRNM